MIDENLLESLSNKEKEIFKKGLQDLINQTYVIEEEYKQLNKSYVTLQNFISQIIEVQPNALWVLDESSDIFLQNSEAKKIPKLLKHVSKKEGTQEIDFEGLSYLIKVVIAPEKTLISATDITKERRAERLASMGQVAAHLSHEIRNPIGSVSLLASTLYKKVDLHCKPLVLEIQKSIWRVERIIKATLLFTKGVKPNRETFYLDSLLDILFESLGHYSYTKEIDFDFDLAHVVINADKELLVLVLQNFLFNAIDAIEESEDPSGIINLSYRVQNAQHSFIITDSGKAIENENILFEPFETTKTKGNGLGLALCLEIIQAHNGSIELLKETKGFCIIIGNEDD